MIKSRVMFAVAMVLVVVFLGLLIERLAFIATAEQVVGSVVAVDASNERCGSGRKARRRYNCTKYSADLAYEVAREQYTLSISAGSARGHNQSVSEADHQVGEAVMVRYDPDTPSKAYRDRWFDIWSAPLIAFIGHLVTLFGSFYERRR